MADEDRTTDMETAFTQPQVGKNDMGEFQQRSLPDLIAMDKHLSGNGVGKTGKTKFLGILVRKISFPGSVG